MATGTDLEPGRFCHLFGLEEVTDLQVGMDFRHPQYRREVYLRFLEFHIKYGTNPGCVYFLIPALREHFQWTTEQAYWWCFLNGNSQHPVTSTIIWRRFPDVANLDMTKLGDFLNAEWKRLEFDVDRRYWKAKLWEAVEQYVYWLDGRTQEEAFGAFAGPDEFKNYSLLWAVLRGDDFYGMGRLSAWSYSEYLRILGFPAQPETLMLRDIDGSKSHRNGLCTVLGRDDLIWRDGPHPYSPAILSWLEEEAQALLLEARLRVPPGAAWARDVTFLTIESCLCTYKSWHRPNRRYPNCYADMLHDRIKRAEQAWPEEDIQVFWEIRRQKLPAHLRLEDNPADVGLKPAKQNHYLETGQPIMMHKDWPCFANDYNAQVDTFQGAEK